MSIYKNFKGYSKLEVAYAGEELQTPSNTSLNYIPQEGFFFSGKDI